MFERFTRDARALVAAAEAEARELGSPTVEAEHLLLALTRQEPTTAAGAALAEVGLDHGRLSDALQDERERSLLAVGISISDFDLPAPRPQARPRLSTSAQVQPSRTARSTSASSSWSARRRSATTAARPSAGSRGGS